MTLTQHFPHVKLTNPGTLARNTRVEVDGVDMTQWCTRVEVVSALRDANVIRLEMIAGSLDIEMDACDELSLPDAVQDYLVKHGWTPPVENEETP